MSPGGLNPQIPLTNSALIIKVSKYFLKTPVRRLSEMPVLL